ncbi:MAG: hypothetical protein O2975_08195, partial [Proteobacteria bacterium]|nr:hypothetical protein [Pseudomonadota bacterium]
AHGLEQRQVLLDGDRQPVAFQFEEEVDQHGVRSAPGKGAVEKGVRALFRFGGIRSVENIDTKKGSDPFFNPFFIHPWPAS